MRDAEGLPLDVCLALRDARRRRRWTEQVAARQIGCSRTFLSKIELGSRVPRHRIATALTTVYRLPAAIEAQLWAAVDELHGAVGAVLEVEGSHGAPGLGRSER